MKIGIARIFYGGGRRYLTLRAACQAEARKMVKARLRDQGFEYSDEWPAALVSRVARMLESKHRKTTP